MGSKKPKQPKPSSGGLPPTTQGSRLAVLYYWRADGSEIGVPYSEWAEYALELWAAYGASGSPMAVPSKISKPDALPLYPDAEVDGLIEDVCGRSRSDKIVTRTLWIYPKV